jgi:hypothetical protein
VFSFLPALKWSPETGFRLKASSLVCGISKIFGTRITFAYRKEMLGRKVNFRRKTKKKTFEEY